MEVDNTSNSKGKGKSSGKGKGTDKSNSKGKGRSKGKGTKRGTCVARTIRARLVTSKPRQSSERGGRCKSGLRHGQVVRKIDSSEIRRISSSPRCPRKDTPRLRKASNLVEDRKQPETVEVTKPILSISHLCEGGIETRLARKPFLKCRDRREPFDQEKRCILRQGVMRTSWRYIKSCV